MLAVVLAAAALASLAGLAQDAQAGYASCALSERDQDPPGGTPAYNLSVRRDATSCAVAKKVMVAFHRCRSDGGASCARRVLASWRCSGRRTATLPLGQPRIFDGAFTCRSKERRVRGAYWENGPSCFGAASRDPKRPCTNPTLKFYPDGEDPYALADGAAGCRDDETRACVFGTPPESAKGHFAVLGDSHALHWRGALSTIARTYSWRGYSHTAGGCFFSAAVDRFTPGCGDWYQATLAWLHAHPEVTTVFMTANADTPVAFGAGETMRDVKVAGYKRAMQALPKTVEHVVVLRDTTASSPDIFECIGRVVAAGTQEVGAACALARPLALREDTAVLAARQLNSERYGVIDLSRYLCGPTVCYPVIGGVLVNGDVYGHLTVSYMRTVAPYLLRAFRGLRANLEERG